MSKSVFIQIETPLQKEVADLLRQSDTVAARLYPGEYRRPITPESLARPPVLLEVGIRNMEAQALYRGAGFTDREPFHPYTGCGGP